MVELPVGTRGLLGSGDCRLATEGFRDDPEFTV